MEKNRNPLKSYLLRKKIFAVLFLIVIVGYGGINAWYGIRTWIWEVNECLEDGITLETAPDVVTEIVTELDESIIASMYGRMNFIETYSYIQVLLDKKEFNNFTYIKDKDGYMHLASVFREDSDDMEKYAKRLKRMQDYVASRGTKVLFFVPPGKYVRGETEFTIGMPVDDPNNLVDELLFFLNRYGVETVDGRKYIPNEGMSVQEAFFKTDHHWTIPAAFEATQVLVEQMEEKFGVDLDPDDYYLDPAQYERVTYRNGMLGSMGRTTGANYSGLEDFEALWPTFECHYNRYYLNTMEEIVNIRGTTQEALMDTDILLANEDMYVESQYSLYLDGLRPYERIINEDNPDGCRILAIRDSYFSPMMVFLAPMCGQIDAIWALEETDDLDIESYVKENEFDYIIVEIYPYNIVNEGSFNFFRRD